MGWTLASDIIARLEDLRMAMGWTQKDLAEDYGVQPGHYKIWLDRNQAPAKSRLAAWAKRRGWPRSIFEEGGPMPATVVNRPAGPSNETGRGTPAPARRGASRRRGDMSEPERRAALEAARHRMETSGETLDHYRIFTLLEIAAGFRKPPGDEDQGDRSDGQAPP